MKNTLWYMINLYPEKGYRSHSPEEAPHLIGEHLLARSYPIGPSQVQPCCGPTPTEDAVGVGCNVTQTATSGLMVQSSFTEIRSWIVECHLSGISIQGDGLFKGMAKKSTLWLGHSKNPHFTLFFDPFFNQWTHCCVSHYCPAITSNCTWNSGHKLVAGWSP